MTTKEKILLTALELFNRQGINLVTTRHVAKEMGISHGNLCYHFPKREDIVYALYQHLVAEFDRQLDLAGTPEVSMAMLRHSVVHLFTAQYKYRFIMLGFLDIMRRIEPIRTHFKALFAKRQAQFNLIISQLIAVGQMKEEAVAGQYERLLVQLYMLADFWLSGAEILFEGKEEDKVDYYVEVFFSALVPLLTDKGLEEYRQLQQERG